HQIVDTFRQQRDIPGYARLVSVEEIEKNDFNLNLPRYIDSRKQEDVQDLAGHLQGGIPTRDVDGLDRFWQVCPGLRDHLFAPLREGYVSQRVESEDLRSAIFEHPAFVRLSEELRNLFSEFRKSETPRLKALDEGCHRKQVIHE